MPANQYNDNYDKKTLLSIFFPNKFEVRDRPVAQTAGQNPNPDKPEPKKTIF
jgi:hypothetical protein